MNEESTLIFVLIDFEFSFKKEKINKKNCVLWNFLLKSIFSLETWQAVRLFNVNSVGLEWY